MKNNMESNEDMKKEIEASAKIMLALVDFGSRRAIEILTGVLCSIINATAKEGKESEAVDAVIKELKENMELTKNVKPIGIIIAQLKNTHIGKNPNLN